MICKTCRKEIIPAIPGGWCPCHTENAPQPEDVAASSTGSALRAVSLALDALRYGGVGDDRPHNRLIQLIESERSKCTGDNWDYWNYLSEKLQKAEHELAVVSAPNGADERPAPARKD